MVEAQQTYQTAITLRRGLTVWLRETLDLVDSGEKSIKSRPHRNIASSTIVRNLERSSAELAHYEKKLNELNKTCEELTSSLEVRGTEFLFSNSKMFNLLFLPNN